MLSLDTNVIVRYLVNDHPQQSTKARNLIDKNKVYVCITVVLETEWVLRSAYKFRLGQIAQALTTFAGLPNVTLEDPEVVLSALSSAKRGIDFADALHLAKSRGCVGFATFDRQLAGVSASDANIRTRLL